MTLRRTFEFLPKVFQTDANKKFLAATLDQLVSEPDLVRVNGYVGRKFAPTYKTTDNYIEESSNDRKHYQLEPSVIIKNGDEVEFYSGYFDLLNKIDFYNGYTNNQDRLFNNEFYTYDGQFDLDKFVNYNQYYWLPNGPLPIKITSGTAEKQSRFIFNPDIGKKEYTVTGKNNANPDLVVIRGGRYKFKSSTNVGKLWIQTEPGVTGYKKSVPNLSSREISGVTNNGSLTGDIEFFVPLSDSQDEYLRMPMLPAIDFAINSTFTELDGLSLSNLVDQLDSINLNPDGKTLIFLTNSNNDADWTNRLSNVISEDQRRGVWKIKVIDQGSNKIITLEFFRSVDTHRRLYVKLGKINSNREFYKNTLNRFLPVPILTAQLTTLYYQNDLYPEMTGKIKIIDSALDSINVVESILNKPSYTSFDGVVFTNGLIVQFDESVEPSEYKNKTFIVEGVGVGINLVDYDNLVSPEPGIQLSNISFDSDNFNLTNYEEPFTGPATPDYITINRASRDLNAWSRQNRWFHIDVLLSSARYNNTIPLLDQAQRAQRPIIEFYPNLQLFNHGVVGKTPVDIIDTVTTDAFNQVQHQPTLLINGNQLQEGHRIIFPNDKDPLVRSQIYKVQFAMQNEPSYNSIYDGRGTGAIFVESPAVNVKYKSPITFVEEDGGKFYYTVTVQGRSVIKDVVEFEKLNHPYQPVTGFVTNVVNTDTTYEFTFYTMQQLTSFSVRNVKLRSKVGSSTVIGYNTKFLSEIVPGTAIYSFDEYIGTVVAVLSDERLQLSEPAYRRVTSEQFTFIKPKIQLLVSEDPTDVVEKFDSIVAKFGTNKGKSYWYNGQTWQLAQTKNKKSIPLFDIFDDNDLSFSTYTGSKFKGNKIFSYKTGTGTSDPVLGFPLSYSIGSSSYNVNLADISFQNNFGSDQFEYLDGAVTVSKRIDSGYIKENISRTQFIKKNVWNKVNELSRQYQIISDTFTGVTNYFEIDIQPAVEIFSPTIKVFLNNILLEPEKYQSNVPVGSRRAVVIQEDLLTVGDKIDILIYSKNQSNLGYYQVPNNLDFNSKNISFETLSLGQIRNNLLAIRQNLKNLVGEVPGSSNIRDLSIKSYAGNILQHSAPIIYASLFLINGQTNFIDSLDYARREYTKFKNKFLELAVSLPNLDPQDPISAVDTILTNMNYVKNKNFPFYHSDMVPYGNCVILDYEVLDPNQRLYKISKVYNNDQLQNRSVLVYHNDRQLIQNRDYSFDKIRPAIILDDRLITGLGDKITIRDYANTDSNYIPPTPTKLGLYKKFIPGIFIDNTYRTPIEVIQGHDGSLTPSFQDHRDDYLLELELRIYNNIKNVSKLTDWNEYIPGRFRDTDYNLDEFNSIIQTNFLKWIGNNKLDYLENNYYQPDDHFTYNYGLATDRLFGDKIPGYWRGIYKYFYDTDRPHTHPWEMLGLTEKPIWWENYYGPPPYTMNNDFLWNDLEQGRIREGLNAGINEIYSRPGLKSVIPVDEKGDLVPPDKRIIAQYNTLSASNNFVVGDMAPVEAAWARTSEYPFAVNMALAIMKPGLYFGTHFDLSDYYYNEEYQQFLVSSTNRRVTPDSIRIHGYVNNGTIERTSGYINWIVDYMTNLGLDSSNKLKNILSRLEVQLAYKLAGYSDKNYLTILAEQYSPTSINESIIIPDDSYDIILNKSVPIERIAYSAVIVERTNNGFSVSGYNNNNPYFIIVPSDPAGESYEISVGDFTAIVYQEYQKQKVTIPYGYEFRTKQQVVDFLISYQRYLFAQGFTFEEYSEELETLKNWELSSKEFLSWAAQGWRAGNIIVLSPIGDTLSVVTDQSVVDAVTNETNGSRLIDPSFNVIRLNDISVLRDNGFFKVQTTTGQTIAFAELNLTQFEHVLIFDNLTIFNDVIYKPESGNRQYRLKLVGSKTANWDGSLNPSGYVYNSKTVQNWRAGNDYLKGDIVNYKNQYFVATQNVSANTIFDLNYWQPINKNEIKYGLLPNWANNAKRFIDVYDVDSNLLDSQMVKMSAGLIGFRSRDYLDELNLENTSQLKFYQGYIKDKGTSKAVKSLLNANFSNLENDVKLYEEWAFRVGEYGATKINQTVEIVLEEEKHRNNPTGIVLVNDIGEFNPGLTAILDNKVYNRTDKNAIQFLNRDESISRQNDIQTAGYIHPEDVNFTLFDSNDLTSLNLEIDNIYSGYTVWVAKDQTKDWDVYRISETKCLVQQIKYCLDNVGEVTVDEHHELNVGDIVAIKNFNSSFNQFYLVQSIIDLYTFTIGLSSVQLGLIRNQPLVGSGLLFKFVSVRLETTEEFESIVPKHGWRDGDHIWVDYDDNEKWATYRKQDSWKLVSGFGSELNTVNPDAAYGTSVKISREKNYIIVGAPGDVNGAGRVYAFNNDDNFTERAVIQGGLTSVKQLGYSVDIAGGLMVAGAPGTDDSSGMVIVYSNRSKVFFEPAQVIVNPLVLVGSRFGTSVSLSKDGQWLYIGSPGSNQVHMYKRTEFEYRSNVYKLTNDVNRCELPYQVTDPMALAVFIQGKIKVLNRDYTVEGNVVNILSLISAETAQSFMTETGLVFESETSYDSNDYVSIVQRDYFKYVNTYTDGDEFSNFGTSVKSNANGREVIVGAPSAIVDGVADAGRTVVLWNTWNTQGGDAELRYLEELTSNVVSYSSGFGTSVDISDNHTDIFVGAPGYSTPSYSGGIVNRYINEGKIFGIVVGNIVNPTVNVGDSIYINDVEITFLNPSLDSVIERINDSNIVGIRAFQQANVLIIQAVPENDIIKFDLAPGVGTAFTDLGLKIYTLVQQIQQPFDRAGENFGSQLKVSGDAKTLMVASTKGTVKVSMKIDQGITSFDGQATRFLDITLGSGTVYSFDKMPSKGFDKAVGKMFFGQEFNAPNIRVNDRFGGSIDFTENQLFIGAAFNDTRNLNAGDVYEYKNESGLGGWIKLRQEPKSVDVNSINYIGLFNKKTKAKIANLDYIDPIKGKNLGVVEQNLTYKISIDPASYNAGSLAVESDYHWGPAQVGDTWWDLDKVRYIQYEQDELIFRMNNWGAYFPGSQFHVYEWVEATVLPSAWVTSGNTGQPLYDDDSAYVINSYVDFNTGLVKTLYYYWVRGRTDVSPGNKRTMSTRALELALEFPKTQGISYAAILSNRSVALFNCNQYLDGNEILIKIDYDSKRNDSVIHSEYELVREGSKDSILPRKIINKIIDSLSSIDDRYMRVPSENLTDAEKIGIDNKLRQTVVVNRFNALRNIVYYLNSIFAKTTAAYKLRNSRVFENAYFFSAEPYPESTKYNYTVNNITELEYLVKKPGDKILVKNDINYYNLWTIYQVLPNGRLKLIQNQSFNTRALWKYRDWYKDDYDSSVKPTHVVEYFKDISKLELYIGDSILVRNSGVGYEIYRATNNNDLELVGVENGTIELNEFVWNVAANGIGYENRGYEGAVYDLDLGREIRNLMIGLEKELLIDDLSQNYNELLFVIIKYILSEQSYVDWFFKTSFVSVIHNIKKLSQYPNYIRDNHSYYESYISEVKPYRTKIREYKLGYTRIDPLYASMTDFDLPGYYDQKLQRFRSPSGEQRGDVALWTQQDEYIDWYNNRGYQVESISISNPGTGYTQPPIVSIIANGDDGQGARAEAIIDEGFGTVIQIIITNPGNGYSRTPIVLINGNGTGATAYARLKNNQLRSIKTSIKFDRISYEPNVREWKFNTRYNAGDIVTYKGKGYRCIETHISGSNTTIQSAAEQQLKTPDNDFKYYFVPVSGGEFENAADRVAANYVGGEFQVPKGIDENGNVDITRLIPGSGYLRNVVTSDPTIYNESATESWLASQPTEGNAPLDINVSGGRFYDESKSHAPEELIPGNVHDNLSVIVQTNVPDLNVKYRWRINVNPAGLNEYYIVSSLGVTRLTKELLYSDTVIHVDDVSTIMMPQRKNKIYGTVVINGEKIRYWNVDASNNTISQIIRGVDGTGTPMVHTVNSVVENQSINYKIPNTSQESIEDYFFDRDNPVFIPTFLVEGNIENVKLGLKVYNNSTTLLTIDKDYTLDLINDGNSFYRVAISFVRASTMNNGIRIRAVYGRDYIWLNRGTNTPADGTGLAGALQNPPTGTPADFILKNPYSLL